MNPFSLLIFTFLTIFIIAFICLERSMLEFLGIWRKFCEKESKVMVHLRARDRIHTSDISIKLKSNSMYLFLLRGVPAPASSLINLGHSAASPQGIVSSKRSNLEHSQNVQKDFVRPDISSKILARILQVMSGPCKNLASNVWSLQESCKECLNVLAMHITRATNNIIYAIH